MKKVFLAFFLLFFCSIYFVFAADISGQVPMGVGPTLAERIGNQTVSKDPGRYPRFASFSGGIAACNAYLQNTLSLAPLGTPSTFTGLAYGVAPNWSAIQDLTTTVNIPANLRKGTKILFTWTVRIEGSSPSAYAINPRLCGGSWWGTSNQEFPEGQVKTSLVVNGTRLAVAEMTIPSSVNRSITQTPPPPRRDPTHTASYLLAPADIGLSEFPASLNVQVQWYNDTSQILTTPANQHNLVINGVPVNQ
jgi:hypothetical protein